MTVLIVHIDIKSVLFGSNKVDVLLVVHSEEVGLISQFGLELVNHVRLFANEVVLDDAVFLREDQGVDLTSSRVANMEVHTDTVKFFNVSYLEVVEELEFDIGYVFIVVVWV